MPMVNHILRNAIIIDSSSPHHKQTVDIWIEDGIIKKIGKNLTVSKAVVEYTAPNLHVSKGWIDMQCLIGEPGYEYSETLESASVSALKGGFTTICMLPNTNPCLDNRAQIEFILRRERELPIRVLPYGALTMQAEGKDMAEMLDMADAGITAFTDGKKTIDNPKLLELILQYSSQRNLLIVHHADTPSLTKYAQMHEGDYSTTLGLKGFPAIAELMAIERDIHLLSYAGGRLHIPIISTKASVEAVRKAKQQGLHVSCGVASQYLLFTDNSLQDFDPLFKVNPPYRSEEDKQALIHGLADATIDVICSDHTPVDDEHKVHELAHADFGIVNLETAFSAARSATHSVIDIDELIAALTIRPATLLGLNLPAISEGQVADLTLFQPNETWTYDASSNRSLSHNTPFDGYRFTGKPLGVICKSQIHLS